LPGSVSEENGTANDANNANEARIADLSKRVVRCALAVANTLGSGFVEKVYENALDYEIRKRGLDLAQCLNYLKATGPRLCLLLNFGQPRPEIKRVPGLRRGRQFGTFEAPDLFAFFAVEILLRHIPRSTPPGRKVSR